MNGDKNTQQGNQMTKKIAKYMWISVGVFTVIALIVGVSSGDTLLAGIAGKLIAYAIGVHLVLLLVSYINTKRVQP